MTSVTVVVPYFNGMNALERALFSVQNQSIQPTEVIVVNDGSDADNTAFLNKLAGQHKVRVIERSNGGQGAARNDGIRASKTKYVCLLDQDDFYLPGHIETLLDAAEREDSQSFGFVYSDVARGTADGAIVQQGVIAASGIAHPLGTIREMLARDIMILPSSMLLNRDVVLGLGGFDERFVGFEDDDLVVRCALAGVTSTYVPQSLTVWTLNPGSASFSPRMVESRWLFFLKLIDSFGNHAENLVGEVIAPRFLRSFIGEYLFSLNAARNRNVEARQRLVDAVRALEATGRRLPRVPVMTAVLIRNLPRAILAPLYALYERTFRRSKTQRTP